MSSDSDESDEDGSRQRGQTQNAFAGLNMDSSSSDSSSDEGADNDRNADPPEEQVNQSPNRKGGVDVDYGSDSDNDSDSSEEECDAANGPLQAIDDHEEKNNISSLEDLVGRVTSNGAVLSSDYVEAVRQHLAGGTNSTLKPTEIQQRSWTTLLSPSTCDRDMIAISKTGSGKTLAFLVPLLASLAKKDATTDGHRNTDLTGSKNVYPRAVILAPTRVLAQQIGEVATTLVTSTPSLRLVRVSVVLGGAGYHQQMAHLRDHQPDLIIATPGRLNSLCGRVTPPETENAEQGADTSTDTTTTAAAKETAEQDEVCIKLDKVVELVLDEADMMLALGFHDDLSWFARLMNEKSEYGFRLVLTSATWNEETSANLSQFESLSEKEPVLLKTGEAGSGRVVTKNVTQKVEVLFQKGAPRFNRLCKLLDGAIKESNNNNAAEDDQRRIIVFCLHKSQARQVSKDLRSKAGIENVVLEGDMSQSARNAAIEAFKSGTKGRVLVATDVAARGLDFHVTHVFNYSLGISMESYIHRCGRTGRAGRFGIAHTFVVKGMDEKFTPELCVLLRQANQVVPDDLRIMAGKELKTRKQRAPGATTNGAAVIKKSDDIDDEEDIEELRRANREKQLRLNQQRQRASKQQQKRRGRR